MGERKDEVPGEKVQGIFARFDFNEIAPRISHGADLFLNRSR